MKSTMYSQFLLLLTFTFALPGTTWANGFEIPEQGARSLARSGAFSARADDPSAAAHNPAGLAKLRGTQVMLTYNALWNHTQFTRAKSSLEAGFGTEEFVAHKKRFDTVENQTPFFPLAGSLFVSSDFGLDNMAFGLSIYGPNSSGHVTFPEDGGSRYLLTELDVLLVNYGVSTAYKGKNWGIGATLQWVQLPILTFSLVVDSVLAGDPNPYASTFDAVATIDIKDNFALSGLLGAWYRPIPSFEIAISGRPLPIHLDAQGDSFVKTIEGTVPSNLPGGLTIENSSAGMKLQLPATARLGMRYRHLNGDREVFDVELDVLYETWSVLDAYDVSLSGTVLGQELDKVVVAKDWNDTVSIRLGGTWNLDEKLSISAGAFWENGAAPKANSHLDFPSANRGGGGGGVTYTFGSKDSTQLDLTLVYHYTMQQDIEVSDAEGRVYQQRPLNPCPENCGDDPGSVSNAGKFSTSFQQLGIALNARF